jgi:alpha-tubulin suppressor-like RCC1 family protein
LADACARAPVRALGIDDAIGVGAGVAHACAIHASGALSCWGWNPEGQIPGGLEPQRSPLLIPQVTDATAMDGASGKTCVVADAGVLCCFGAAEPAFPQSSTVWPPLDASLGTSLSVADGNICAVTRDATAWCWGDNANGQLGDGTTEPQPAPAPVGVP